MTRDGDRAGAANAGLRRGQPAVKLIGLMSGTSLDGVDAALVEISGDDERSFSASLLAFRSRPYAPAQRREIREAIERGGAKELCRLDAALGRWWAPAVRKVCDAAGVAPEEVAAIGSHGQTIWHAPPAASETDARGRPGPADAPGSPPQEAPLGASLQLGNASVLAEETKIPVVGDFRSADLAAGGEGAPLVPFADRLLYAHRTRRRALQNLGGMGNVTWLPPKGSREPLLAFDTGPGVALVDAAAEMATGGRLAFDEDGRMAASGVVDPVLLAELMDHPFFRRPPPRSTGRELFGREMVRALRDRRRVQDEGAWRDLLATLTALTARSIGEAYRRWVIPRGVDEVSLTGGGAHNPCMVEAIRRELAPLPVRGGEAWGWDPDAREAVAFAILAWARLRAVPGNVPEATGAGGPRVLGSLAPAPGRAAAVTSFKARGKDGGEDSGRAAAP